MPGSFSFKPTFSAAAMSPPTEFPTNAIRLPLTPISAPCSATHFGVIPAMFCLLMLASELAKREDVELRQSYLRLAKRAAIMVGRYTHAHQFKRARRQLKFLRTRLGRIIRDIRRKIEGNTALEDRLSVIQIEIGLKERRRRRAKEPSRTATASARAPCFVSSPARSHPKTVRATVRHRLDATGKHQQISSRSTPRLMP